MILIDKIKLKKNKIMKKDNKKFYNWNNKNKF